MADREDLEINIGGNASGVETSSRQAKAAIGSVTAQSKELEAAFRRIKSSLDPTFAAQERYNKTLADAKKLMDAGKLSQQEYTAATRIAKQALDESVAAIAQNSAAARAAAAELKAQQTQAAADARAAAQASVLEARQAAQQKAAAERAAAAEARAAQRTARQQEKEEIAAAAAAAKSAAKEKAAAEKAASQEALAEEKSAKAQAKTAAKEAAAAAVTAAKEKKDAEKIAATASRDAAQAAKELARAEAQAAASVQELRASIDPAYAAQARFNQTMQRATQLLMENKLKTGEWTAIQKQAKAQMDLNVRSLGRMNSVYVQMGYQTQDIVASMASGISPLVILAQQGGQTAAALSMMGGTVGRVAAFFAGPWGAAIIGATLLLGLFMGQHQKAKHDSLDLTDALQVQKAKLDELTEALKKYNIERKKANDNDTEAKRIDVQSAVLDDNEVQKRITRTRALLENAKAQLAQSNAQPEGGGGSAIYYAIQVQKLTKDLKELEKAAKNTKSSLAETMIPLLQNSGEDKLDGGKKAQHDFEKTQTSIQNTYRAQIKAVDGITDAKKKQQAIDAANLQFEKSYQKALVDRKNAEDAWAESKKKGGINETAQYSMPVSGKITSGFGAREAIKTTNGNMASTNHAGIDIAAPAGTPVKAPQVGVVTAVGYSPTLGKYIVLEHGAGVTTRFGHMSETNVQKGQQVDQGTQIGKVGQTGNATGPHLHYELRINGKAVDPSKGIFPIDKLKAEEDAAKHIFESEIADYDEQIKEADDNYVKALEIQDKKIAAIRKYYGDESKEAKDAMGQRVDLEHKYQDQILQATIKGLQAKEKAEEAAENARNTAAKDRAATKGEVVALNYSGTSGAAAARAELAEKTAIMNEEYQEQVVHENRMYQLKVESLRAELALEDLPASKRAEVNAQIEQLEAEHQERMANLQQGHARDTSHAVIANAQITVDRTREIASTVTGSINSVFQGLWSKSMTFTDAMFKIADDLVFKFFDMGTKIVEDWVVKQLTKKAVTVASEATQTGVVMASQAAQTTAVVAGTTAQVAATATGAAATTGITLGAAILQIGAHAATAAAGAYSALAAIPVIGPFIAPAAAIAAFAAVIGFVGRIASAAGGWGEVDQDQMAMVHKKEMILPAKYAEPLRRSLTARDSSGMFSRVATEGASARQSNEDNSSQQINFHYKPTHHYSDMDAERMLEKDGSVFRKWVSNQIRNGAFK